MRLKEQQEKWTEGMGSTPQGTEHIGVTTCHCWRGPARALQ